MKFSELCGQLHADWLERRKDELRELRANPPDPLSRLGVVRCHRCRMVMSMHRGALGTYWRPVCDCPPDGPCENPSDWLA